MLSGRRRVGGVWGESSSLFAGVATEGQGVKTARLTVRAAYSKVARFEYLPAEFLLILIPVLLVFDGPRSILNIRFAETVAIFFLLYFTGFMANALADRDIDSRYRSYKASVARAVETIGVGRLRALLLAHVAVAVLLTVHLFMLTGNSLVLVFVALGLFLGIGYSLGPFHFKTRGVAHGISLSMSAFFLPLAFIIVSLTGALDFTLFMFITGFTLAMYSLEFGNQAMDYFEDLRSNVQTPSVRYSIKRTIKFSIAILVLGLLLTALTLGFLLVPKLGAIAPIFAELAVLVVPTVLVVGFLGPAIGLGRIYHAASGLERKDVNGSSDVKHALKSVDHPRWQASGASGVVVICILMFAGILFPMTQNVPDHHQFDTIPTVEIQNDPDMIVNVGEETEFEAEVIDDSVPTNMFWNFGDLTGVGGKLNTTHRYTKIGKYTVEFRVTDKAGHEVRDWVNITVTDLYFSKLVLTVKSFLTYKRIYYDYNVTNDKALKHQDELVVYFYYESFPLCQNGLIEELYPAKVWANKGYFDIATLDNHPELRIILIQNNGGQTIVIEDRTVRAE